MPASNVSQEIEHLMGAKKYPQKRAVAAALSMQRAGKFKSHLPKGATLSPHGDIGEQRCAEADKVVRIPGWGKSDSASRYLPYRSPRMAGGND